MSPCRNVDLPEPVLPAHEQMLRRALAQPHRLQPPRAGPTDRHDQLLAAVARPVFALRRRDLLERHFDLHRVLRRPAGRADDVVEPLRRRRPIERQRQLLERRIPPAETASLDPRVAGVDAEAQPPAASIVTSAERPRSRSIASHPIQMHGAGRQDPSNRNWPASSACDRP